MSDSYQRIYDVGLLDDLHNYFPSILYEPERFTNVAQVLYYIRQRTQSRFNLFDYGRRQHDAAAAAAASPRVHFEFRAPAPAPRANTQDNTIDATNIINNLILPLLRTNHQNPFQDVIVHASQEIIDASSTEETLEEDEEENCIICQDRMRQGELVRTLTVCQHQFHRSCIDSWLLHESVMCPTCRHDIRQPTRIATPLLRATSANSPAIPPISLENPTPATAAAAATAATAPQRTNLRQRADLRLN